MLFPDITKKKKEEEICSKVNSLMSLIQILAHGEDEKQEKLITFLR